MSGYDKPKEQNPSLYSTHWGAPVDRTDRSMTIGARGPVLMQDVQTIEKLAHFDRERVPERVVHAIGAGAHGYFELTKDMSQFTKAKFLQGVGKRTAIFTRFSLVVPEKGGAQAVRDVRGFATKFYTEEGNYDLVANNLPVFFIRNTSEFPDVIHAFKKNPKSNLPDPDAFWEFISTHPESTHAVTMLFSDRGIPKTFRQMHGFGNHTFKFVNDQGKVTYFKWHWISENGIDNLTQREGDTLSGIDDNHASRDLFDHLEKGEVASWKACVQLIPEEEEEKYKYDLFDVTKVVLHSDYPLIEIGKLVLNRNPENFFAETEQVSFSPGRLVPGIEPTPDNILQGRLFSYFDTARHRLNTGNIDSIPINCPYAAMKARGGILNEERDSYAAVNGNQGSRPTFSQHTAAPLVGQPHAQIAPFKVNGVVGRYELNAKVANDFEQPRLLYQKVMRADERARLISNICTHMSRVKNPKIRERAVMNFWHLDKDLGLSIALGVNVSPKIFGIEETAPKLDANLSESLRKFADLNLNADHLAEKDSIMKNKVSETITQ